MAITCIPNQAVNFCTPSVDSCGCFSGDWCTPVEQNDTLQFKVEITEATGTNLLSADESTFNAGCGGVPPQWACGAKWTIAANKATFAPGSGASTLSLDLGATLTNTTYYRLEFDLTTGATGTPTMNIQIGGLIVFAGYAPGVNMPTETIVKQFFINSKSDNLLSFTPTDGDIDIENVVLTKMSYPDIKVNDRNGVLVQDLNYSVSTGPSTLDSSLSTLHRLYDVDAKANVEWEIDLLHDGRSDTTFAWIELHFEYLALDDGCYTVLLEDEETSDELTSNCINLRDAHDCAHLLSWENDSDHFKIPYTLGAGIGNAHVNYLRVCSRLDQPSFDAEGDLFTDDAGTATLTFAKKTETLVLQTEPLPEFIHDALSNGIIHDNFFIDGVEYVKLPGDYQPDWQNDFDLAPVRIEVSKQSNENVTNRSCS